jgi:hypothetical protein
MVICFTKPDGCCVDHSVKTVENIRWNMPKQAHVSFWFLSCVDSPALYLLDNMPTERDKLKRLRVIRIVFNRPVSGTENLGFLSRNEFTKIVLFAIILSSVMV